MLISSRRQWVGDSLLTQKAFAYLAGLAPHQVSHFERCIDLPTVLETVLRIAIAANTRIEHLIHPSIMEHIVADIERRRAEFAGMSP